MCDSEMARIEKRAKNMPIANIRTGKVKIPASWLILAEQILSEDSTFEETDDAARVLAEFVKEAGNG